jgi:hypothetical protein
MNEHQPSPLNELSEDGRRRRAAMLPELVQSMRSLHQSRRRRKRAAAWTGAIAITASAAVMWSFLSLVPHQQRDTIIVENDSPPPHAPPTLINAPAMTRIARVNTDSSIVERYRVADIVHTTTMTLDDDGLLLTLQQINRPAGLVRTPTRTWLTNPVTDAELNLDSAEDKPST